MIKFEILAKDKKTSARAGRLITPHGTVNTPVFIPVGTKATVKTMTPEELKDLGVEIILANAYHLFLRPGHELIAQSGGLHSFMNWEGPILTDSGGYQVFSLSPIVSLREEGVEFRSLIDGSSHFFSPELAIEVQEALGADIIMTLDQCPPYPAEKNFVKEAVRRTTSWASRCQKRNRRQTLFGIIQGGIYKDLRQRSTEEIIALGFSGYAIGGLSVGEPHELTYEIASFTTNLLPPGKPRYLMGVGSVDSLLEGISVGIDMFDCALPTRVARNGLAFTSKGRVNIRNQKYARDFLPLDENCSCYVCQNYHRSYLRHLFLSHEVLPLRLLTWHNLFFTMGIVKTARNAILENKFSEFKENLMAGWLDG